MEGNNRLIARQTNLKILVDALCLYMKEHHTDTIELKKPIFSKKCDGPYSSSDIYIYTLYLNKSGKSCDMGYVIAEYMKDNSIMRRITLKQISTTYISWVTDCLINEGVILPTIKEKYLTL